MAVDLADFLAAIGRAGVEANAAAADYYYNHMKSLMVTDAAGRLTPKEQPIVIDGVVIDVPEITMMHARIMGMRKLHIKLATRVSLGSDLKTNEEDKTSMRPHLTMKSASLFGNSADIELEATFEAGEPLESVEQIRDTLNTQLQHKLEDKTR